MGWTCKEVVDSTGAVGSTPPWTSFVEISTDSRRLKEGALFIALRGLRHDGHDFALGALRNGAAAVMVEELPRGVEAARALIVDDTLRALGDLAAYTRQRKPLRVVAITGSNGKTTTKEMVAAICAQARFPPPHDAVLKTKGNENNLIGLPLTLLRLAGNEAVAVLEMGMNARGEIARLTEIATPDVGVVTNVGPAHLEGLGSIEGVARAKGELFATMKENTTIAVNMDDEWVVRIAAGFRGRRIEFGQGREVSAQAVRDFGFDGVAFDLHVGDRHALVRLHMSGAHNVPNAMAAAAVAHGLGLDLSTIHAGLEAAVAPSMRMQIVRLANRCTVVNDAYNANPASMAAALRAIGRHAGRSIAVLGEMRELGPDAAVLHREVGRCAAESGVDVLVAVGPLADDTAAGARQSKRTDLAVHVCPDAKAAARLITSFWQPGDAVLVKGSRGADGETGVRLYGARMAEVVALLEEAGGT
jgi:UDP-N-acetylmuramoyl-tripeptide--D-alanyl-D-alanine ligase